MIQLLISTIKLKKSVNTLVLVVLRISYLLAGIEAVHDGHIKIKKNNIVLNGRFLLFLIIVISLSLNSLIGGNHPIFSLVNHTKVLLECPEDAIQYHQLETIIICD